MLVFLEFVKFSRITEVSDGMEHAERTFRILVNLGDYKS
jgi:hypothetical protein